METGTNRYAVKKESGSRYAYIVDTHYGDEPIYRYDVLRGDNWTLAEKKCERMNLQTMHLAMMKARKE